MNKNYSFKDYEDFISNRKKLLDSLKTYLPLVLVIFPLLWVCFTLRIAILITTIGIIIYLSIVQYKLIDYNKKIKKYEEDKEIKEEKQEIKKQLSKLRKILKTLNLEEERTAFYTNKYLNLLEKATTLMDYKSILQSLKDEYLKYYEIWDEDKDYYKQNFTMNGGAANSFRKNQKSYYERKDSKYYYDADAFERQQKTYANNENKYQHQTDSKQQYMEDNYEEKMLNYLLTLELVDVPKTKKELKTHYRNLLKKYHPDQSAKSKNFTEKELETKTMQINEAYDYILQMINED